MTEKGGEGEWKREEKERVNEKSDMGGRREGGREREGRKEEEKEREGVQVPEFCFLCLLICPDVNRLYSYKDTSCLHAIMI